MDIRIAVKGSEILRLNLCVPLVRPVLRLLGLRILRLNTTYANSEPAFRVIILLRGGSTFDESLESPRWMPGGIDRRGQNTSSPLDRHNRHYGDSRESAAPWFP
jgi:hypothetical protein